MPTSSALRSGIKNYARYLNVLSGTEPYVAPPTGAYDLLATEILTGTTASVTFSSLNSTYGSTYQHLQLRITARTGAAYGGGGDPLKMTFNEDTGTNYGWHQLYGFNGNALSNGENASNQSYTIIQRFPDAGATANAFGAAVIDILDPFETTKYKTARQFSGQPNNANYVFLISNRWQSTNALTSITLATYSTANYVSGSRISLYGWKAA